MNVTQWYAVSLGAIGAACLLFYILKLVAQKSQPYATLYFLKYVFYPEIPRWLRGSYTATRFDALLILGFLAGNGLCLSLGVHEVSDLIERTGLMAIINFMPLAFGSHLNFIFSHCGAGLDAYTRVHRWLGRVSVLEVVVHAILAGILRTFDSHERSQMAGLIVSATACPIGTTLTKPLYIS